MPHRRRLQRRELAGRADHRGRARDRPRRRGRRSGDPRRRARSVRGGRHRREPSTRYHRRRRLRPHTRRPGRLLEPARRSWAPTVRSPSCSAAAATETGRSARRWAPSPPQPPIGSSITSDNPRDERPSAIIAEIVGGIEPGSSAEVVTIVDRREAIREAIASAARRRRRGHRRQGSRDDPGVRRPHHRLRRSGRRPRAPGGASVIAIMLAGASSMLVSLFGTRYLIVFFRQRGQGQPILGKEDHGPEHHMLKQGTPTMGGIAIVGAAFDRLAGRPPPPRPRLLRPDDDRVGRRAVHGADGVPRRLHQGPQAPQPRHLLEAEELHHDAGQHRDGLVARRRHRHLRDDQRHPGRRRPRGAHRRLGGVGRHDHLGDHERRQRHRRPRRARLRVRR